MNRLLLTTVFVMGAWVLRGQDMHFSQFSGSTMHLSPAAVGMMEDRRRLNLQYRNQWGTILGKDDAFKTMALTYEERKDLRSTDFFGWGVGIWSDKAGGLQHDEGKASIAYARKMAGKGNVGHYLVGGGQAGLFKKSINLDDREWVNQHDGNGGFDPTRAGGTVLSNRQWKFDASMGLGWYSTFGNNNHIMGGFALQHLNRPEVSFDNSLFQNLYVKKTYHLAGEFQLARFFNVAPSLLMMQQGASTEYMMGGSVKMILREPNRASMQLGAWLRTVNKLEGASLNDALVITARFDWEHYGLGFSYDVNTSLLNETNNANHSVELLLSYKFGKIDTQARIIAPRFL